jgi:cytochrome c biogenesis protein CcdA
MEWLQQLIDNSNIPIFTAFILGVMTSVSPCPMAMNITATAYLSRDISSRRRVLLNGIFYTLGGVFAYTVLATLIYLGASQLQIARWLQHIDIVWVGIALIVFGVLLFDFIKINIPFFGNIAAKVSKRNLKQSYRNAFLLGVLFALAFCPTSALLYFGGLIPITVASTSGLLLPLVFSVAAYLPVIVVAWLLAYSVSSVGKFFNRMKAFEVWFKRVVAVVFIVVGVYLIINN